MTTHLFKPELVFIDGVFHRDKAIGVENGVITSITDHDGEIDRGEAMLPGFINAHSHAFQRALRGLGETFQKGSNSFWGWREEMYKLVEHMSAETFRKVCIQAFLEMRQAGITSVGEFHYLHHATSTDVDFTFDQIVLDAASEVGIRIVLLHACYLQGGFDSPLQGGQLRFSTPTLESWWQQVDHVASSVDGVMQRVGVVAHSLRAVDIESVVAINQGAMRRGMPLHLHIEEQRQEISDCLERYGKTPMHLLNDEIDVSPLLTAVHCTHTADADMVEWLSQGGNVCICPCTEGNLADGICNLPRIVKRGGCVSLGTDSNARISMIEEMRWLEYVQRLRREERGICIDSSGDIGGYLLDAATVNGARSLGLPAGKIEVGMLADFAMINLHHSQLEFATKDSLLTAICCGSDNSIINRTIVGGE